MERNYKYSLFTDVSEIFNLRNTVKMDKLSNSTFLQLPFMIGNNHSGQQKCTFIMSLNIGSFIKVLVIIVLK